MHRHNTTKGGSGFAHNSLTSFYISGLVFQHVLGIHMEILAAPDIGTA